jgi:signal recognition particle subunit SRP54
MLERYKEFSKVIGKLGKMGLGKKGMDMTQMMRNPAQLMQNIEKAVDPRILKQMKGSQNMMNMMRQVTNFFQLFS